jgi:intracellular septation protein
MADKKINPILKQCLELGPLVLLFAGFMLLRGQTFHLFGQDYGAFIVMTAVFVPLMVAATGALWFLTGKLSNMQIFTVILVVILGGMSVWFNDEHFIKMKPTFLYLIAALILFVGLLRGQSYLANLLGEVLPLQPEGWMIFTRRMTVFFVALAVANEVVWRNMSTEFWISFKLFGLTAALFAFLFAQYKLFEKYGLPEDGADSDDPKD